MIVIAVCHSDDEEAFVEVIDTSKLQPSIRSVVEQGVYTTDTFIGGPAVVLAYQDADEWTKSAKLHVVKKFPVTVEGIVDLYFE